MFDRSDAKVFRVLVTLLNASRDCVVNTGRIALRTLFSPLEDRKNIEMQFLNFKIAGVLSIDSPFQSQTAEFYRRHASSPLSRRRLFSSTVLWLSGC